MVFKLGAQQSHLDLEAVTRACNLSSQEAETGGSQAQSKPGDLARPCLKTKQTKKKELGTQLRVERFTHSQYQQKQKRKA